MAQRNSAVRKTGLLPGHSTPYFGRGKFIAEAAQNFRIVLIQSLLFIYMVLAAQFESYVHAVTIVPSPLSIFVATPVFYSLFDDLGRGWWARALLRAPASVWNRFGWAESRVEGCRPQIS